MTHIVNRFDIDNIIAGIFKVIENPALYSRYGSMMESELFFYNDVSPNVRALRLLIDWMHEMVKKNVTKLPSLTSYRDFIHSYPMGSEENEQAKNLFDRYFASAETQNRMRDQGCFDIFLQYLRIIRIIKYSNKTFKEYQNGNVDEAAKTMQQTLLEIAQIKQDEHDTLNTKIDIPKIIFETEGEQRSTLFLDCTPLDNLIGGFEEKTLNLFISLTGGGKSMMSHHLIKRAIAQKLYIHVTCTEDRKVSFTRKLLSSMTGISLNVWKDYKTGARQPTSEERKLISEAAGLMDQYLKVDFVYGMSIEGIHKLKKEHDLACVSEGRPVPVVDIVDYTGHIAARSSGDKMYEQMRNAYAARKDYALANGKICFDFAQVNREGSKRLNNEEKTLGVADLAGSFDLAQVCDNIISVNRSQANIMDHKAVLKIAKARDGEVGHEVEVGTNFVCAQYVMADHRWLTTRPQDLINMTRGAS